MEHNRYSKAETTDSQTLIFHFHDNKRLSTQQDHLRPQMVKMVVLCWLHVYIYNMQLQDKMLYSIETFSTEPKLSTSNIGCLDRDP